jgi:hypothetical protein
MSFEIFTRKVNRSGTPAVTLTTMGRMALNKAASATFEKNATEYVLLMWDKDARKVAIRPITKKDPRAYRLSYAGKGNGAGYSCVTFLNHINYDFSKTRNFPVEWNNEEDMFVFGIPKEFLVGRPKGEQLSLQPIKRADRARVALAKSTEGSREDRGMTQ